ncbi:MAG: hypothetical protein ACP5GS_07990 [Nitrososphaeria archaeon]
MLTFDELVKSDKVKFRDYIEKAARNRKGIDDSFFAESLSGLIKRADPADFFNRTEVIPSIREFFESVLRRLSAMSDEPAFMLDTVMGGGKTHAMAYLYFMLTKKEVAINQDEIRNMLRRVGRDTLPDADVIAIDGNDLDARLPLNEQEALKPFFENGANRKSVKDEIARRGKPVVFIMDEMLDYLVKREDLFDANLAYLKTLVEGVAETENSVVVISVPADFSNRAKYEMLKNMFSSLHRRARIIQPVGGPEDFYRIVRKQLLERVDPQAAEESAKYAYKVYAMEGINPDERFKSAFPFHPELIEIFSTRFASFENFQRTRESLKILASISVNALRRVYDGEKFQTPFITPGDVDLMSIKDKVTSANVFKIPNLEVVVNTDIAPLRDLEKKMATVVYLYSLFNDPKKAGADRRTIYRALLLDSISSADIEEKMEELIKKKTIYFDYNRETGKFYTAGKPNIYAQIDRKKNEIGDPSSELIKRIEKMLSYDTDEVYLITTKQEPVEGKLNIAIYPPRDSGDPERLAEEWELFSGKNRNGVVLLYPADKEQFYMLIDEGKRLIAINLLKKEFTDKETREKLEEESKISEDRVSMGIMRAYSELLWAGSGRGSVKMSSYTDASAYRDAILKTLAEHEKAYTTATVGMLNVEWYINRLLGQRISYDENEAYDDVQESTSIPFLTRKAFRLVLEKARSAGLIAISASGEKGVIERISRSGEKGVIARPVQTQVSTEVVAQEATRKQHIEKTGNAEEIQRFLGDLYSSIMFSGEDLNFDLEFSIIGNGALSFRVGARKIPKLKELIDVLKQLMGDGITLKVSAELSEELWKKISEGLGGGL